MKSPKTKRETNILVQQLYLTLSEEAVKFTTHFILYTSYFKWLLGQWRIIKHSHQNYHDYLVDEARIVAVLRSEGNIYDFCSRTRMPFQYELVLGNLYVGIFSRQSISKPQIPIHIEGVEGIVAYLLNMYTNQNNFVIAPFMGHGEILIACERMGRICFMGDENPELVSRGIMRWQEWSGKQAEKTGASEV